MKTDLEKAEAIIAKRVAELDAKFNGRDGLPMAYFKLVGGGIAIYVKYCVGGITEQGANGGWRPSPVEAAQAWVENTRHLDDAKGTLHWRRRPKIGFEKEVKPGESDWQEPHPDAWLVFGRLVITEGDPDLYPKDEHTIPEDYKGWAEMREKYLAGIPMSSRRPPSISADKVKEPANG